MSAQVLELRSRAVHIGVGARSATRLEQERAGSRTGSVPQRCPECGGTGLDEDAHCEFCGGTGREGDSSD